MTDLIDRAAAMAIARACERQNGPLTASGATDYGKGLSAAGQAIAHAIAALPSVNDDRLNKAVVALEVCVSTLEAANTDAGVKTATVREAIATARATLAEIEGEKT